MSSEITISLEKNQAGGYDYTIDTDHKNGVLNHRFLSRHEVMAIQKTFASTKAEGIIVSVPEQEFWRVYTTTEEREEWIKSWQKLSKDERTAYIAENYKYDSLPDVAKNLNFDDVKEVQIGICGSANTVPAYHSEKMKEMVSEVEEKMVQDMVMKGVLSPEMQLTRRMFEIESAVKQSVIEQFPKPSASDSEEWEKWYEGTQDFFCNFLLNI